MDANYIYDIFETTDKNDVNDLAIGLAMLRSVQPIPDGLTDRGIREFLGRHYNDLVDAYKTSDREKFAQAVSECSKADEEAAKAREEADG